MINGGIFSFLHDKPMLWVLVRNDIKKKYLFKYILKISPPKTESFQITNDMFHISAQNIECRYSLESPRRGGSNEYPQSMCF